MKLDTCDSKLSLSLFYYLYMIHVHYYVHIHAHMNILCVDHSRFTKITLFKAFWNRERTVGHASAGHKLVANQSGVWFFTNHFCCPSKILSQNASRQKVNMNQMFEKVCCTSFRSVVYATSIESSVELAQTCLQ